MQPKDVLFGLPVAVLVAPASAYAAVYLTVEQAQQLIFPNVALAPAPIALSDVQKKAIQEQSGVRVRSTSLRAWRTPGGDFFIVDDVLGKHEYITYAVGITARGTVKQVEILEYRETYGDAVRRQEWLAQFAGKNSAAPLRLDEDIRNISGATLSSRHITDGIKRLLATYEIALR